MGRTVAQGFDVFLERLTPLASQRAAAAAHRSRVETSLKNSLTVLAMRETGSFHHGTGVRNYSDVDVLASIGNTKPSTSDTALNWVKNALSASFPATTVRISRPAVVVEFAGGDETWEVIPGFLTSSDPSPLYDIPGPASGWIESAPTAHLDYVNECNRKNGVQGAAKKLARLIKAWKYYCNVPISSFYLEMRAAQHMASQPAFIAVWDVCLLLESLHGHGLAAMNDPKGRTGRFHPCSSDYRKTDALSKLSTAATRARKALDAYQNDNFDDAFYYLNLLFGGNFPAR
ncbi:nucleotidyltransferase [Amycolatopsis sp. cg5]|uniref:SMODS domain-containing nucleotidyltransferase n=1 Tax=Amycolatopsis sp. cg5 TaxID=3238802 RepID=UPI0035267793